MTILREFRLERAMTQAELAEKAGLRVTTISRLENGEHPARVTTVRKLAEALGVEPSALRSLMEKGGDR